MWNDETLHAENTGKVVNNVRYCFVLMVGNRNFLLSDSDIAIAHISRSSAVAIIDDTLTIVYPFQVRGSST